MSKTDSISQARLRDLFEYAGGFLVWKSPTGRRTSVGGRAGFKNGNGYFRVQIQKQNYSLHRLVYIWHFGSCLDKEVDHVDGDKSNNSIENLRLATRAENCRNRTKIKTLTSTIKGVSKKTSSTKWRSRICVDGKTYELGSFKTEEEAANARIAAQHLHGEFARL